ncbi:MAG TPA: hypothetical protein VGB94_01540 [Acidobacteriaceae bacterium]
MAKSKKSARVDKAASNETTPQTGPVPKDCKLYAKQRMLEVWPGIVDKLVEQAEAGSYNHTKLLVEVSGIKDEDEMPPQRKPDSMMKILLKRLGKKAQENGDGGREAGWPRDGKGRWLPKGGRLDSSTVAGTQA